MQTLHKYDNISHLIVDITTLKQKVATWKLKSEKVVFTNGCFDILHKGHLRILEEAAQQGNKLIVGINTDASVKRLKGPSRPINHEMDRALLVAAMKFIDAVILFDEDTPHSVILELMPDVLVKGGDYTIDTIVGAQEVVANGGSVHIVPTENGYSTTNIIAASKNTN